MTDAEQREENVYFIAGIKYFGRIMVRIAQAQTPQYKCSIRWGNTVPNILDTVVAPPTGLAVAYDKLVAFIRFNRPMIGVEVIFGTNIVPESGKLIPGNLPVAAYPATQPTDNIPDPYKPPVYCWPCTDKIYIA